MEQMTIREFLQELSSKKPVPGGGGASALTGAAGMALGSMVADLTIGKKKYAAYEADIRRLQQELQVLQEKLTDLMQADAEAFEPLAAVYRMPKATPQEQERKAEVMEQALLGASLVPLEIMRTAAAGFVLLEELIQKGSVLAVSDAGVGAAFLRAAVDGAALNVYINTKMMKDREKAETLNREAVRLQEEAQRLGEELYGRVLCILGR